VRALEYQHGTAELGSLILPIATTLLVGSVQNETLGTIRVKEVLLLAQHKFALKEKEYKYSFFG